MRKTKYPWANQTYFDGQSFCIYEEKMNSKNERTVNKRYAKM